MKINSLSFLAALFFLFAGGHLHGQSWVWAKRAGSSLSEYPMAAATNDSGNVYVTGYFTSSSVIFGSTTLYNASSGAEDIYLVKYSSTGSVIWARNAGGSEDDAPRSIATDDSGNVYVTGWFTSPSITFGGTTLLNTAGGYYYHNGFIVKYKSNGTVAWAKNFGVNNNDQGNSVSCDHFGHVYVAGQFASDSVSFGGGVVVRDTAPGTSDVFLAKFTTAGAAIWAKKFGYDKDDAASSITISTLGDICIAGIFNSSSITIGTTTIPNVTPASGVSDVFITRLDSNGNVVWAVGGGGSWYDEANSIAIDNTTGDVYVAGDFNGTGFNFGSTSLSNTGIAYTYDAFVMKLNATGSLAWVNHPTGGGNQLAKSLVTNATGSVYVTGFFGSSSMTLGSIVLDNPYPSYEAVYIARYNPTGGIDFATTLSGGTGNDWGTGMAMDTSGDVYVCGSYESPTIGFDAISLSNASTYNDMFVARMHYTPITLPPAPITGITSICTGASTTLSDPSSGGSWASSNISVASVGTMSGIVTGTGVGTAIITYSTSAGIATIVVTVSAAPPPITSAAFSICPGGTTTLVDAVPGGTWSSSSSATATVGSSSGIVNGIIAGTSTLSYFHSGCHVTAVVTVNSLPDPSFSGTTYTVCAGHIIILTAITPGGTWTSSTPAVGAVTPVTGIVTGVAPGTTTIKHKVSNSCGADSMTHVVTVTPAASCSATVLATDQREFLQIYPNPNKGTFALMFNCLKEEQIEVVITNILGRTVGQYNLTANKEVNISLNQPAGVYIINARTTQTANTTKVVIE